MPAKRLDRLAELGCIVCRRQWGIYTPAEIHHLKGHRWSGMGKRASDEHAIPLCPIHHRHGGGGEVGYHQSPKDFTERYGTQEELLADTIDRMGREQQWDGSTG